MPRRSTIARKTKYQELLVGTALTLDQFTNKLMHGGKRQLAARILEDALARCEKQAGRSGVEVMELALRNAMPLIEVKPKRVGGSTYQIPVEVRADRRISLGMRWLIDSARKRNGHSMGEKLAAEFVDASNVEHVEVQPLGLSDVEQFGLMDVPADAVQRRGRPFFSELLLVGQLDRLHQ